MPDHSFTGTYYSYNEQANMGPFYDSTSDDYYVILQQTASTWDIEMWRSTNDGDTYTEQDSSNRPTPGGASQTVYGVGATGAYVPGTRRIYVFYWVQTASLEYTLRCTYFSCSTNTWAGTTYDSAQACHAYSNTFNKGIDVEYRSSTDIGVYYMGQDEKVMGAAFERMNYEVFNPSTNAWAGSAVEVELGIGYDMFGGCMTYDSSGDVICSADYYAASGSRIRTYKIVSGTDTNHGQNHNITTADLHFSSYYSGLSTEEFGVVYSEWDGSEYDLYYGYSTSPTTTPWSTTKINDGGWDKCRTLGGSICYVGTKRYLFAAYGTISGDTSIHMWTKDGTGAWTETGLIYDYGASLFPRLRVNHLKSSTNEWFGFVIAAASTGTVAVVYEEGAAVTRSKTASVDAISVPPEGILPEIVFPEVVMGDLWPVHNYNVGLGLGITFVVGVDKSDNTKLIIVYNEGQGKADTWSEVTLHDYATEIKSLHLGPNGASDTSFTVTTQHANGDVYWGLYSASGSTPATWGWVTDTHRATGGAIGPWLVASPGTPDEYGAICCGSYFDPGNNLDPSDTRVWVFYHEKVSTNNKIMWASSKHDAYYGEFANSGGSYFTGSQRLDPDSTDDEYLGAATNGIEPTTDGTTTATSWKARQAHVLYTRVGATTTNLIKRQVWSPAIYAMYTDATSGTFALTINDRANQVNNIETVTSINYNSSAATIKSALEGTTAVQTVNVTGAGTKANPWIVDFDTYYSTQFAGFTISPNEVSISYFEPDSTGLTGGSAYVGVPTVETDLGQVKHQSRLRAGMTQDVDATGGTWPWQTSGGVPGYSDYDGSDPFRTNYIVHVGTDEKPMYIKTPDQYSGTWDWRNQWVFAVAETAIGTKLVKVDSNGFPAVSGIIAVNAGYLSNPWDLTEHRIIWMVEKTTDDVHMIHRVLRDTNADTYSPTQVQAWTYTSRTRTGSEENPTSIWFRFERSWAGMHWIEQVGTNLKYFWEEPGGPGPSGVTGHDKWGMNADYGMKFNRLLTDYDSGATWGASTLSLDWSWGSFESNFIDSNGDIHKFTFKGDQQTIGHQWIDSADVGDNETSFAWSSWTATHQTFATTAQYIMTFAMAQDGDTVHMATLEKNLDASSAAQFRYFYYKGDLTTKSWSVTAETIWTVPRPSGQAGQPLASITSYPSISVRSDDYIAVALTGTPTIRTGTTYDKDLAIGVRNTSGTWTIYDAWRPAGNYAIYPNSTRIAYGASDRLHVFFTARNMDTFSYHNYHQSMSSTGTKDTINNYQTNNIHYLSGDIISYQDGANWRVIYFYDYNSSAQQYVYAVDVTSGANPTIGTPTHVNTSSTSDYQGLAHWEGGERLGLWSATRINGHNYVIGFTNDDYNTAGVDYDFTYMWMIWHQASFGGDWSVPTVPYNNYKSAADGGDFTGTDMHEGWPLRTANTIAILAANGFTISSTDYLAIFYGYVDATHYQMWLLTPPETPSIAKDHTFDAIIKQLKIEVDHTFDAVLTQAATVAIDHTFDAIVNITTELDHTFDANVIIAGEEDHTFDAIILGTHTIAADMDITINATPAATDERSEIVGLGVVGNRPGGTTGPGQGLAPFGIKVYRPVRRIIREDKDK
jgi:hypothetical protein